MPELPEVETTLQGIAPHIKQQRIAKVTVRQYRLRWPVPANIHTLLSGKTIIALARRGKYLLLTTPTGTVLIHLGMSGVLRLLSKEVDVRKHDHIDIYFHNGKILRFTDPRRFGLLLWVTGDPYCHPLLENLGVEPLLPAFSAKYLWAKAQATQSVPIKSLVMDSKVVVGVGNIYATEALFQAGIHPLAKAKSLSLEQLQALVKAIKKILRHAIKQGGTTLKDFVNSAGKPGYFSAQLKAYGRSGLPCVVCGLPLQQIRIAQRSTVYCEGCQREL
jgi:formamidopyrimidine-DNA glycosylase